jgi:hypothetical protein
MKVVGIGLYILVCLIGLMMILWGAMIGFLGMGPDGSIDSISIRIGGVGGFLLGVVYITPVWGFSRKSLIFVYAIAAMLAAGICVWGYFSDSKIIWNSWRDPALAVLLLLVCPLTLSVIAFIQRE